MNDKELLDSLRKMQKRSDRVLGYIMNQDQHRADQHLGLLRIELNALISQVRTKIERDEAKFKADAKRFNDRVQAETDAYLRRMDEM